MNYFDFLLILNLIVLLYIWFETDAVTEWGELLRLKFLKYKEYKDSKTGPLAPINQTYCEFLLFKYGKYFLVRLITCPVCFTVWCNIVLLCVFYSKTDIIMFGPNVLLSWIGYHSLRLILQKLNA